MPVEGSANSFEFRAGHSLQQQNLASPVADPVKQDAACRRASCGQQRIKKRIGAILINVSRNHRVKGHAEECGIDSRDGEYCPRTQRLEQSPNESDIARAEMFQEIQIERTSSRALLARALDAAEPEHAGMDERLIPKGDLVHATESPQPTGASIHSSDLWAWVRCLPRRFIRLLSEVIP